MFLLTCKWPDEFSGNKFLSYTLTNPKLTSDVFLEILKESSCILELWELLKSDELNVKSLWVIFILARLLIYELVSIVSNSFLFVKKLLCLLDENTFNIKLIPSTIDDYNKESEGDNTLMIMLTGRIPKLANQVESILNKNGIIFDEYHYKERGDTFTSKINTIKKSRDVQPLGVLMRLKI